jgi:type I restriction enzyme S subunit
VNGGFPAVRLKYVVDKIGSGKTPLGGSQAYVRTGVMLLRSQNVHFDGLHLEDVVSIDEDTDAAMASTRVEPEDVLLNITGASLGRCTVFLASGERANVNQHVCIIRSNKLRILPAYLSGVMQSAHVQGQIFSGENGSSREGLTFEQIGSFEIPIPSLMEQTAIVDYLGRETARLDALVEAKERVLGLLAEKRRALITRAVTRGLNDRISPVMRLKFLLDCIDTGFTPKSHNVAAQEGQCGVLKSGCVNGGIFNSGENKLLADEVEPPPEWEIRPGDVLMSRASGSTELIGSVALVREQPVAKLYLSDKTFRLRVNISKCEPEFLVFAMGSTFLRNQIEQGIRGAEGLANNIAQSDIREFLMPVLTPIEQRAIVSYIAAETAKLDGLWAATERTIALLKERRAALIAAAVTGQIDAPEAIA